MGGTNRDKQPAARFELSYEGIWNGMSCGTNMYCIIWSFYKNFQKLYLKLELVGKMKTYIVWQNSKIVMTQKRNFQKVSFLGVVGATVGYTHCVAVWINCSVYLQSTVITHLVISQLSATPRNYPPINGM